MSFVFDVKVVPRSGRNKWMLDKSGTIKCYLKSPPERGLANKELIKLVAKALSLTQQDISIVFGAASRKKRISVNCDLSFERLLVALGIERQQSLFE